MISLPTCPICGQTVAPASDPAASFSPFCSRRCKQVDLMRWCDGKYSIVEPIDPRKLAEIQQDLAESEIDEELSDLE
jgi:endogenous inhibitor of DNA gyrase (YacG/DUF329 family)